MTGVGQLQLADVSSCPRLSDLLGHTGSHLETDILFSMKADIFTRQSVSLDQILRGNIKMELVVGSPINANSAQISTRNSAENINSNMKITH